MASVWKGSVSFGLVNIPVRLHPAVRVGKGDVHFRQLHREDLAPIKYERVCTADGESVPWSDIVNGYEYSKGKFVAVSDEDLKAAAAESSTAIEMIDFVKQDEIDPRFFDTPYFLVPEANGQRAYALFREALRSTETAGIGKFALRQKQHLVSIKAVGDALVLEIMRFADELRDPTEHSFPSAGAVRPEELAMAEQLIGSLTRPFEASKYTDESRESLMRIIRAKLKGKKITAPEPATADDTKVIDLVTRLQESLAQAKAESGEHRNGRGRQRQGTRSASRGTARTAAARASRARRTA